ncbi:phage head closure protein [Caldifermentibacillus hisashii]|uniref:phage head closure protein n=1 Tax=Caldifermentibacillus hisashii TaxID=996558 RepID=UPI0031FD12FC
MPQLKPLHETFNDGFLLYGYDTTKRENGKRVGEEFTQEGKLAFKLMSARDQDYQLVGALNATLDLKVKTLFPPRFRSIKKTKMKCVIDDVKYDVINVDWDSDKRYLYFYLQEVGKA